jgi:UDP-N-acetylglucosamine--N-acetylmuramyl-(pentapeptide) pyrophosphoryl-undecaprenol N-acetylglucosamine transferase
MSKILLTGGGTMGHMIPCLAMLPDLREQGHHAIYIGSRSVREKELVLDSGISFYPVYSGKLRRYFDIKNFFDLFKIFAGFLQSLCIMIKEKPDIVFSKGGYVSVPVVYAAYLLRIPAILHESDITMGLANRLCAPFVKKICYSFEKTKMSIDPQKAVFTGIPVRKELFEGSRDKGLDFCGFSGSKPVLLVMGGSQGSRTINEVVFSILDELLDIFQVCHICGKDSIRAEFSALKGYRAFEYIGSGMEHIFAMADIITARAGATSIFEFLALKKPHILIPLPEHISRGDQVKNAESFKKKGYSAVIEEGQLDGKLLLSTIKELYHHPEQVKKNMTNSRMADSSLLIIEVIEKSMKKVRK